ARSAVRGDRRRPDGSGIDDAGVSRALSASAARSGGSLLVASAAGADDGGACHARRLVASDWRRAGGVVSRARVNRRGFLRSGVPLAAVPYVGRTFPPSREALRRDLDEAPRAESGRSANTDDDFVAQAERLKPSLTRTAHSPVSIVEPVADSGAF